MHIWAQAILVACVVVATIALVPALVALRRAAERSERVLGLAEQELRPLTAQLARLLEEVRSLGHEGREEIARIVVLTDRAEELAAGVGRVLSAVAALTRAGQLVGIVAGLTTGLNVFVQRLRRQEGDHHG